MTTIGGRAVSKILVKQFDDSQQVVEIYVEGYGNAEVLRYEYIEHPEMLTKNDKKLFTDAGARRLQSGVAVRDNDEVGPNIKYKEEMLVCIIGRLCLS